MSLPKITLRDSLYIPIEYIDTEKAEEEYRHHIYDEEICKKCEYKRQRHSDECNNCELGGYVERVEFFKYKTIKGVQCMGLPIGDRTNIERRAGIDFDDFDFRDLRTDVKFDYKVKFTGQLRDYQMPLYDGYLKMKHGIIKAPPRTGKTVTSIAIAIKLGRRVAIIASQVDFLENFLEEIQQYTNLPALEEKTGKKLFGFLNKDSDYENFQIGLATYQSFISDKNGKARLKLLNKNFGTVWTDEIHKANAAEFSKFLAATTAKFKGGCTATNNRKDCVPRGHLVLLAGGQTKAIEDIAIGDYVQSFNHQTERLEPQLVVDTYKVDTDKRIVEIHHEFGVFECTEDHEVWSETRGTYVRAIDLTVEDVVKVI